MKQTKNTAESHRLEIYVQNVHHLREHMHSNDYATETFTRYGSNITKVW